MPLVLRLVPTIRNFEASPPLSDSDPESVGDAGDIVTLIAPMTVPDGAPPWKLLFERLAPFTACEAATGIWTF